MDRFEDSLFLTMTEIAKMVGLSSMAVSKICKKHGLSFEKTSKRTNKINPEQVREIVDLVNKRKMKVKSKSVAIHTCKGGVGKTTSVYILAVRAAMLGLKTLVIDCDKQANITDTLLQKKMKNTDLDTLDDIYENRDDPHFNYHEALIELAPTLHLIPANLNMASLDLAITNNHEPLNNLIEGLLPKAKNEYDFIIFDMPSDFSVLSIAIHCYVDSVIIPITPDDYDITGVELTIKQVDLAKKKWGCKTSYSILFNKFDQRTNASFDILEKAKRYGKNLVPHIIPSSAALGDARHKFKNVWLYKRSKVPALDMYEKILFDLLSLEKWNPKSKKSKPAKTSGEVRNANA